MRIHRITSLWSHSYLLEAGDVLFLVDGGMPSHAKYVFAELERLGRSAEEIGLAVVTHGHLDHFGGLLELQRAGAFDVGCHPEHVGVLETGEFLVSPGWSAYGKTYSSIARRVGPRLDVPGLERVVALDDGRPLHEWGVDGLVLHTPGHSTGCLSVVLDDGSAFVGDLVQGPRIPRVTPVERPNMAIDPGVALASWRKLLDAGVTAIYPGHGAVISRRELEEKLARARRGR